MSSRQYCYYYLRLQQILLWKNIATTLKMYFIYRVNFLALCIAFSAQKKIEKNNIAKLRKIINADKE